MSPLGSPFTPFDGGCSPMLVCPSNGAGARLGSPPPTPGVEDEVRIAPTDDAADESAAESGFVGFFRYAAIVSSFCYYIR